MAAKKKSEPVKEVESNKVTKPVKEPSVADKIWDAIKDQNIEVFALPDQKVRDFCKRADVIPDQLFLYVRGGAVTIALEELLHAKGRSFGILGQNETFVVEQDARFTKIKVGSVY